MAKLLSVGPNIWIADGPCMTFLAMRIGTRSTLVRLTDGSLWFHSPIAFDAQLAEEINALGPLHYLIAPNVYHHLFLADWQRQFPDAELIAAPGLSEKRSDLKIARLLDDVSSADWLDEINQTVFSGNKAFDEFVFFHPSSGTLILTDLIVNIRAEDQSVIGRMMAKLEGVTYPDGGTPLLYRLSMKDKEPGRAAVRQMLDWDPKQVIISHGEWFRDNARHELQTRFGWLLKAQ